MKKMENKAGNRKSFLVKCLGVFLILTMVFCTMTACSSEEGTDGVEAPDGTFGVTNDAIHFSICYPQSFVCDRNDGMISVSPSGGEASKANISVHESSALAEAITPSDHWIKSREELEKSGFKCNFLESKEIKLCGEDALQVVYGMEVTGNVYKVTQIFAYKYIDSSHRMFTVTFTGTETDYQNNDIVAAFKTVVDCFAFKTDK